MSSCKKELISFITSIKKRLHQEKVPAANVTTAMAVWKDDQYFIFISKQSKTIEMTNSSSTGLMTKPPVLQF